MAQVSRYYYLQRHDDDNEAVAYGDLSREWKSRFFRKGWIDDWERVFVAVFEGIVTDFLPSDVGLRLCSAKLRSVIDENKGDGDFVQWLPVSVKTLDGAELDYWALHFYDHPDVINVEQTMWAAGGKVLVRPVLDKAKLGTEQIFTFPKDTVRVVVSEFMRQKILQSHSSGIQFSGLRVA